MPRAGKQVEMLRKDGYATAVDVAEATGHHLSGIHAAIKAGVIPGRRIGWGWYVDIRTYVASKPYPPTSEIMAALIALAKTVGPDAPPQKPKTKIRALPLKPRRVGRPSKGA